MGGGKTKAQVLIRHHRLLLFLLFRQHAKQMCPLFSVHWEAGSLSYSVCHAQHRTSYSHLQLFFSSVLGTGLYLGFHACQARTLPQRCVPSSGHLAKLSPLLTFSFCFMTLISDSCHEHPQRVCNQECPLINLHLNNSRYTAIPVRHA